jgi:hypothetical protein
MSENQFPYITPSSVEQKKRPRFPSRGSIDSRHNEIARSQGGSIRSREKSLLEAKKER